MQMQQATYTLTEALVQAIVANLNHQPAGSSRQLLNALEATCIEQDQERAKLAEAAQRAEMRKELETEVKATAEAGAAAAES